VLTAGDEEAQVRTLQDMRVLITGGASGIGRAMAEALGAAGAHLVLGDVDDAALARTAEALRARGLRVDTARFDVTDPEDVAAARERINAQGGPIDVLVNNAGTVFGGTFLEVPLQRHLTTYRVNTLGPVIVTHAFLADLLDRPDAHVVNIASLAGLGPGARATTYASSKWAVIGFSESLEVELRVEGHGHVHVTTVCPGVVATDLFTGTRPLRLTRTLTPRQVAERVVAGVLAEKPYVRTPWLVAVVPTLRGVLPHRAFVALNGVFGGTTAMAGWDGHTRSGSDPTTSDAGPTTADPTTSDDRPPGYNPTAV
jgi:all-trans-retinol dehydrogenase (NAD+)